MDFFQRQEQARRNTKLLVVYFCAGVATLIAAVYLAVVVAFIGVGSQHRHRYYSYGQYQSSAPVRLWNPVLFLWVAGGTLSVILIGSFTKTMELSAGGSVVS